MLRFEVPVTPVTDFVYEAFTILIDPRNAKADLILPGIEPKSLYPCNFKTQPHEINSFHPVGCRTGHSSTGQNLAELDRRKGFKDIKLGSRVDSVNGAEFKKDVLEKNEYPVKLYTVDNDEYKSIGEVRVKKVEVKAYKEEIYEIVVITTKDTRLMKGMEKSFGKPVYILPTDTYNWKTDSLSLTFKDHSRNELRLTYRYYPVLKKMQIDKGKKIDAIAEDF